MRFWRGCQTIGCGGVGFSVRVRFFNRRSIARLAASIGNYVGDGGDVGI